MTANLGPSFQSVANYSENAGISFDQAPALLNAAPTSSTTFGKSVKYGNIVIVPNVGAYIFLGYTYSAGQMLATWQPFAISGGTSNVLGTANQITATTAAGVTTLSLPSAVTMPGSLTMTGKFNLSTGANSSTGVSAAMTAGAVTVANTSVTASSKILAYPAVLGTVTRPQAYYISAIVAATSFTITSQDATDTSTWNYAIFN
jgi:hypothetical protein